MRKLVVCTVMAIAALAIANAQESGPGARRAGMRHFAAAEMGTVRHVVTGAPYSATATVEVNRTLSDGTKIHRVATGNMYRDSQGRVRNEIPFGGAGPMAAAGDVPKMIVIVDPVAGTTYILDPANKTARKAGPMGGGMMQHAEGPGAGMGAGMAPRHMAGGQAGVMSHSSDVKRESLGAKTIDGVATEGTRTTTVIPAGAIGNDKPLNIVSERWFAPHLQIPVMTKHSDPRMGETTFNVTKIVQGEPDSALFQIPAGYSIVEGGARTNMGGARRMGPRNKR